MVKRNQNYLFSEGILVPAPFYSVISNNFECRTKVKAVPVYTSSDVGEVEDILILRTSMLKLCATIRDISDQELIRCLHDQPRSCTSTTGDLYKIHTHIHTYMHTRFIIKHLSVNI